MKLEAHKVIKVDDADYSLLHIGAVALLGDVAPLQSYYQSFSAEDHLGFDENTQQIHLERALALAKEAVKSKQLSYALIKKVAKNMSHLEEKQSS
ncbi:MULTISPECIES: DUF6990 domain-containing protein [unclassified Bartonella]|uniref:DUF6990 domain-containing protein n=1 Tax=unclassified Bartonella TaxID=2645622 RepID=UPI0035CFEB3F